MADSWTDRRALRTAQYATDANLAARQSIYAYQHPRIDLPTVVLDLAALGGDETLADVGCGNGRYLSAEFGTVTRHDLTAELRLPDAGPIEAYARSLPTPPRVALPPGPHRIHTHTGILTAT